MTVLTKQITRVFDEDGRIGDLREGMRLIHRSGIYDILRRIGTPTVIDHGESASVMAGQAHFAAGYQLALDHLQYFEEMFGNAVSVKPLSPPDFGGKDIALRAGHIRAEDLGEV